MSKKQKAPESPALDSCKTCYYFHDETESGDEVVWGECWRYPPVMMILDTEAMTPGPVCAYVTLPYGCGEHKQRLQ